MLATCSYKLIKSVFVAICNDYQSALDVNEKSLTYVGWFIAFYLPALHFFMQDSSVTSNDSLAVRLVGSFLCLGFILKNYCPRNLQSFYHIWAYITFSYIFPFFGFYMMLLNHGHNVWLITMVTHYFYTKLIFDWINTLILWFVGVCAAMSYYMLMHHSLTLPQSLLESLALLPAVIFASIMFDNARKIVTQKRIYTAVTSNLKSQAGSIAHEMRNPLAQIHDSLQLVQLQTPDLYSNGYIKDAYRVIENGLQVIDITMDAIKDKPIDRERFTLLSARDVVLESVADFAYIDAEHANKVSVTGGDFKLMANPVMVKYVLYNLIKNALWYVKALPDAAIVISVTGHQIEVRDTGPGIAADIIPKLFDGFYSADKQGGTGLGLSYCKRTMMALGGDIHCHSELGHYTTFVLSFPVPSQQQIEKANVRASLPK